MIILKFFRVEMDGINGIVDGSMVSRKQGDYERGRKPMAADTTAAIEGTLSVHTDAEVTVCDAHWHEQHRPSRHHNG